MNKENPKLGPEGFYLDENGNKADAKIHDEMLAETPREKAERLAHARAYAKKIGISQKSIDILYRNRPQRKA